MTAKGFSEEQIIGIMKEVDAGAKSRARCRRRRVAEVTIANWTARYAGTTLSEVRLLNELEAENSTLKRLFAEAELKHVVLKVPLGQQW